MYGITIQCTTTQQIEHNKVFLFSRDYKRMLKRINEIVYADENKKEWALKKIEQL
jgi:hypothetical protein